MFVLEDIHLKPLKQQEVVVKKSITYPYIPEGREIRYVNPDNVYMRMAKEVARERSLDKEMPGGAIIKKHNFPIILGWGANGSDYHETHGCRRVELGCKSGEGYELCEGCSPKNHSELTAIEDAVANGEDVVGTDLYLWGHWWLCQSCWDAIIESGIADVYLMVDSEILFNKEHPDNIVGRQFGG